MISTKSHENLLINTDYYTLQPTNRMLPFQFGVFLTCKPGHCSLLILY